MSSDKVITFTHSHDIHPVYVSAVMEETGQANEIIILDPIISEGGFSVGVDENGSYLSVRDQALDIRSRDIKSVWNRRRPVRIIQREDTLAADHDYLESCAVSLNKSISLIGERTFSVNPATGILHGGDKFSQMVEAARAGLYVPRTIISNDFFQVQKFLEESGKICVKSIRSINWLGDREIRSSFTRCVSDICELDRDSVEVAPTIYQELIQKNFEARITVFGNYYCASKIDSQCDPATSLDWRRSPKYLENLSNMEIDDALFSKLKAVMKRLGIRFGTFDLAFNADQGWVFFEVNESGQFLWQESYCGDCVVLEPFARFLAEAREDFVFDRTKASKELSMEALKPSLQGLPKYKAVTAYPSVPVGSFYLIDERSAAA